MWLFGWELLMVSHHLGMFGGYWRCGSGDILFLVAEEKNSRCSRFSSPLLFFSKGHWLKAHGEHTPKALARKRKRKKGNCKVFCVTRKRNNLLKKTLIIFVIQISKNPRGCYLGNKTILQRCYCSFQTKVFQWVFKYVETITCLSNTYT